MNNYKYLGIVLLCAIINYFGSGSLYLRKETGVFTLFLAIMTLELAVSVIQAYVFTILTCSYIKDSINLH